MRNSSIDLMRGLSVIVVFLYHARILQAGHIGVDIFFVISGYIITSSISNMNFNMESIKIFYIKRIFRLTPPLLILFPIVLLGSLMVVSDSEIRNIFRNGIFSLLFMANIYGLIYDGYFSMSSEYNPFRHMWSLSIEEQFYIIIIPLIFLYKKFIDKKLVAIIFLLPIFLMTPFLFYFNQSIDLIYLSTITRGWELCIGVVFALNIKLLRTYTREISSNYLIIYIAIIIFISYQGFGPDMGYYWYVQSVFIAVLTMFFISTKFLVFNLVVLKLIAKLGILSYGFYVYHYPLLVFSRWIFGTLNLYQIFVIFTLTLFVSFISYKYIETPLQIKKTDQ